MNNVNTYRYRRRRKKLPLNKSPYVYKPVKTKFEFIDTLEVIIETEYEVIHSSVSQTDALKIERVINTKGNEK